MKKRSVVCLGMLVCLACVLIFQKESTRMAAARAIAGDGMLGLVQQSQEENVKPKVALTFDDGPSKRYTPKLLEGLKEREVHASFFLMGRNIEGNEEVVRQIQEEGHLIGNHTYNHVQLTRVPEQKAREEIEKTSNEIFEITGVYPSYVRPPYGSWPKNLEFCVDMFPVPWSIDTLDWKTQNVNSVLKIVEKNIRDGSIILMHDGYETSVEAAMKLIDRLKEEGYEFVTVDELLVV